jgi:hypothetical protein
MDSPDRKAIEHAADLIQQADANAAGHAAQANGG